MSFWRRLTNVFHPGRLNREIDEELQSHIDEAVEQGRDAEEARRAFGSALRTREESREFKIVPWLDNLRADFVFGWRQLRKSPTASSAAILSLALAVGACTAAFRLIDALLLRPMPVVDAERLFVLTYQTEDRDGTKDTADSYNYPDFRAMRAAVKGSAELLAISSSWRTDLTFGADRDMERAYRQWVSGWTFSALGLRPAIGRLLTANDDVTPGGHPVAVISYDYWNRRFGRDPGVVGRSFRIGNDLFEIVGVVEQGFTGTEPGTLTDLFIPTMMNAEAIPRSNWQWFRTWVQPRPGADVEQVRQRLMATFQALRRESSREWIAEVPQHVREQYVSAPIFLEPAAAGFSSMQKTYRRAIVILGVLVGLVLLIACANLANLLTAQASSREREMALRVSIGAGRRRLVQLLLAESTIIATLASMVGAGFAWWAAPFVVGMINPPDNPARFVLSADWRIFCFIVGLSVAVTFLFGLAPALRASGVKPVAALKGGADPHSRRRLMHAMVAAQVAFCFLVHFVAGLFVSTFDRLANQPTGFSTERLLAVSIVANDPLAAVTWDQMLERLRASNGVESAAFSDWALMSGAMSSTTLWANGHGPQDSPSSYVLGISPGWLNTMKIPFVDGRDFRPEEASPNVAIVNESFARTFFSGENPVGRSFEMKRTENRPPVTIVGYVRDAKYDSMRNAMPPTAYFPARALGEDNTLRTRRGVTAMLRTQGANPLAMAPLLRNLVPEIHPELRVSNIVTEEELVRGKTIRERMLAMLSLFFAGVAILLAGIGLYGVLDYSVVQLRRDIGIRLALGAQADSIVRRVTTEVFSMLALGSLVGLVLGIASERYLASLLFEVKATDLTMLLIPIATILTAAVFAALPPVLRALRINPAIMLRAD